MKLKQLKDFMRQKAREKEAACGDGLID